MRSGLADELVTGARLLAGLPDRAGRWVTQDSGPRPSVAGSGPRRLRSSPVTPLRIGVLGYGYWGPNLARNLAELDGVELRWCADPRAERLDLAARRHPRLELTRDAARVLDDPALDAVVIATPVSTHHGLARQALERGKHVLVEKPMTRTAVESAELLDLARARRLTLMVGHTFVYTGAVRKLRELVDARELGDLYYLDSVRVNLGLFRADTDVVGDLASHDLAILAHLLGRGPESVQATGADHRGGGTVDVVHATLHYAGSFKAHLHVSWLSPVKIRRMLLAGSRRMLVYDDLEPVEKVRVYDRGVRVAVDEVDAGREVPYRTGETWAPGLEHREALAAECEHFVECVRLGKTPVSDGEAGLAVVRQLEAIQRSVARDGARVAV
jgi:predicted dehydrogenase